MSNIVNKVKEAVTGHHEPAAAGHHTTAGTHHHNTTAGPHSSDTANKMDPRVDSDRDGSRTVGGAGAGYGHAGTGMTGTHGTHGTYGTHNTTAGPHSSDMANKMDPRVDSDRDGSRTVGGAGYGHAGTGMTGTHGTHSGMTGTHGTGMTGVHGTHNTTAGPHSSDMANKMDPRVDSDRDGSHTVGGATHSTGYGTHGTAGTGLTGTHGTHHNTTGVGAGTHGHHGGPGPAPNTAGPHKSDILNKMDPRVDSDLDGSKTVGGDKTFSSGTHHT